MRVIPLRLRSHFSLGITLLVAGSATQPAVKVHETLVAGTASLTFASILQVREISGGRVLVNDPVAKQLVLLDSSLSTPRVVFDSTMSGSGSYGPVGTAIIPYLADSTIFVDRTSFSLVLLDPDARIVRTIAAPPSRNDFRALFGGPVYATANGDLVFRLVTEQIRSTGNSTSGERTMSARLPDSAAVVRFRFDTRVIDTLGRVRQVVGPRVSIVASPAGQSLRAMIDPLEEADDWALLADGSVALIRGHDYRIEFRALTETSSRRSSQLPYARRALTEGDKRRLIDSTGEAWRGRQRTAIERGGYAYALDEMRNALLATAATAGGVPPEIPPPTKPSPGTADQARGVSITVQSIPAEELPEFYPAVRSGSANPDRAGNLWIVPATGVNSRAGELVYDVVTSSGTLTERVRLPVARSVIGFGASGMIYLMSHNDAGRWQLERARVVRDK